ncbi:MAG TPA: DUF371 domain-containing protein [Candidatus Altiarchaeales archaeon]|nr:DUF371 domain-containing protein [Candidatus Altiarchaeales archaeon]
MPDNILEKITARGHENIRATHKTTIEITKDNYLTPRGDCIIAVSADKGFLELSDEFKNLLRRRNTGLLIEIECSGITERINAHGHPDLSFKNPDEMVIRKSNFICDRTLVIGSDKGAIDINRELVEKLRAGKRVFIRLVATQIHSP